MMAAQEGLQTHSFYVVFHVSVTVPFAAMSALYTGLGKDFWIIVSHGYPQFLPGEKDRQNLVAAIKNQDWQMAAHSLLAMHLGYWEQTSGNLCQRRPTDHFQGVFPVAAPNKIMMWV